jgi:hypothetical protein
MFRAKAADVSDQYISFVSYKRLIISTFQPRSYQEIVNQRSAAST